jgi:hypothetical protein
MNGGWLYCDNCGDLIIVRYNNALQKERAEVHLRHSQQGPSARQIRKAGGHQPDHWSTILQFHTRHRPRDRPSTFGWPRGRAGEIKIRPIPLLLRGQGQYQNYTRKRAGQFSHHLQRGGRTISTYVGRVQKVHLLVQNHTQSR